MRFVIRCALGALVSVLLSSCGGGAEDVAPGPHREAMPALPPPAAAIVAPDQCTGAALTDGLVQQTPEGCMRSSTKLRMSVAAAALGGPAPALTAALLMDWAESHYPQYLRGAGRTEGYLAPYTYRYYPATGNYLAVSTGASDVAIYIYGPVSNGQIQRVGALRDFTCTVLPTSCVVSVAPISLSLQAAEGGSQQAELTVTVPAINTGKVSLSVANFYNAWLPSHWLSATLTGPYTIRVTASAGDAPVSSNGQGTVYVTHTPLGGGTTTSVSIPVQLVVVRGLVAPPAQTRTLDGNATAASLSGSVNIERGDKVIGPWKATSSASWLVLSGDTGETPGTLSYSIDLAAAAALANFADHVATVTVTAPGIKQVSFPVTLRKRIPYIAAAMPYGIPAGMKSRVMVGGGGFSSFADITKAIKVNGLTVSNVTRLSDTLLSLDVTPPAAGTYEITLAGGPQAQASAVSIRVAGSGQYLASSLALEGDDMVRIYLHDPVRQAIFALSPMSNALYKYSFAQGAWTVSALPLTEPYNFALTPDGRRLIVMTRNAIKSVDPDALKITATYALPFPPSYPFLSPLAVSVDGRLWIPGLRTYYLDLADNTVKQAPAGANVESDSYYASGDGATVLIAPSYCCTPRDPWHLYKVADRSITGPMGSTDPWYDAQVNVDGTRVMSQSYGQVWDENWDLVGQLPDVSSSGEYLTRLALSPDGSRIAAVATKDSKPVRIDVFTTTQYTAGTTRFRKLGSITFTSPSADCGVQGIYGCTYAGRLIVSPDNQWVFWMGNKKLQVFKMP